MGYIKKLKNNELVGGTDKTTIYPVTSTEAVFEEVIEDGESNFKSQKFLNNNITGDRINQETITNYNIAKGTLSENRLDTALKTKVQEGYDTSWKFKGEYDKWATYDAHDVVYDTATNSSYISLQADNQWHPVNPDDEAYVEGWWQVIMNGKVSTDANNALVEYIENDLTQHVTDAISDANGAIQDMIDSAQDQLDTKIAEAQDQLDATTQEASDAAIEARDAASTVESLTSQQVADAQIGYFTCTDTAASGAAANETKITTTDTIGVSTYTKTVGSHVKVKMAVANTHAAPVYLQFGSNTANKAQLYYNGEPASASNSWNDNETISAYYDGTYYQASNAMGGGSAVGKKKLTGATGYITTNGDSIGAYNSLNTYRYIKYPVNPGDVVMISGQAGTAPRLYAIAREDDTIIQKEESVNAIRKDFVLVMPEEAKWIVLNNNYSTYPNYEWYYAKAGSVGAHEMLTEAYLYGDWRILSTGQTYAENEAVKTTENQLLRITKTITPMTITDTIVVGDVKVFDNGVIYGTYKAQKAVSAYNGTETEGLYAIGRPSIATITVDATSLSIEEDTDITVTIRKSTQTITVPAAESETKAADIAALIAAAFTNIDGWTLTDNKDGTLALKCNTGGANTIVVSSEVGETGLVITSTAVNGADTLSQYNEGVWGNVAIADYAADAAEIGVSDNTKMWQKLSVQDIINSYTTQNNISSSLDDIGTYETTETLIFNQTTKSAGAGATNAYLTVPVNFIVGNKYRIVATLSKTIGNIALTSYLRQSPGSSTGITLTGLSIPGNTRTKEFLYEPKEGNNYQYFDRYAKTTVVMTVNYKVYLLGSKTVKKKIEEIDDKVENSTAYLYGDLRTLAVGQTYDIDTAVKTTDNQLRRTIKDIKTLSLSETLVTGDIRVNSSNTYRATSTINTFNPSTSYSAGAYAFGSMTVYTLTVNADSITAGNITVNGTDVAIEDTDTASTIATKISSALNIDGWTDSVSENVVTVRCNTIGNNTTTITITDTDNTGVAVASSSVAGTSVIRKYDGKTWTNASVSGMVTDGKLVEVDVAWLITNATQQNSVTQDIEAATTYWENINIASIANSYVGMYNSGGWKWQNNQNNNYGKFVSIEPGRKYKMVGGTVDANYALLKNNTHVTGIITNFATGETGRTLAANATVIITPPADTKYLYFRTNSNGGLNRTIQSLSVFCDFHDLKESYDEHFIALDESVKSNEAAIKIINDFPDIVITGEESVDIASLEERDCSLGSNGKWYYNGSSAGKHKAIEVEPDSVVGIKISVGGCGFYGWVTSSYTSPAHNAIIPYAVGTGRKELYKKDTYTYLKAPGDAKYLIICTVDGGGVMTGWEVVNCEYNYKNNNFVKFRIAHWNIGHFSGYDGAHGSFNPNITPENAEAMARRYKQVINDVGADVLGIAEYDPNFTTDGQKSKDIIFQCYNTILEGTKKSYNCNTLMFNGVKFINSSEIVYTSKGQDRYIKFVNVEISGRPVCIIETHWDFDSTTHRRNQATQLLNLVKDYKYVIICGDLNTYDTVDGYVTQEEDIAILKIFRDAGFEFANNGYLDPFTTATDGGSIDHIMVKGFSMSNRHTSEVSGTLSDHYLLYCDLVMNP